MGHGNGSVDDTTHSGVFAGLALAFFLDALFLGSLATLLLLCLLPRPGEALCFHHILQGAQGRAHACAAGTACTSPAHMPHGTACVT